MVQVRMRQENLVNAANTPVPEKGGDLPPGDIRTTQGPGIVKKGAPVGCLQYGATSMSDGQKGATQFLRMRMGSGTEQADAQPGQTGNDRPAPAKQKRFTGQ